MTTAQDKLLHCILWAYTFLLTLASTMSFLYVNNVARRLIVKFCDVYVRNWVTLRKGALKALWLVRYNRPMFSCANRSCFCRLSLFHCFKVLFDYYYKYYYICDCHCLLPSESIGSRYTLRFVCLQNLNKKKWKKISISRYHTVTFVMQVANNIGLRGTYVICSLIDLTLFARLSLWNNGVDLCCSYSTFWKTILQKLTRIALRKQ